MTTSELKTMGAEHFTAGLCLTPFDCREVDAKLFGLCKLAASPAKEYTKLRGAFNRGFLTAHANQTMEVAD